MKAVEDTKSRPRTGVNTAVTTTLTTDEKINSCSCLCRPLELPLVSGLVAAGGLLGLVKGYFQALAGL